MVKKSEESNADVDGDINDPMKIRLLLEVMPVKAVPILQAHMHEKPWSGSRVRGQGPHVVSRPRGI
jgi:hypothetical protein